MNPAPYLLPFLSTKPAEQIYPLPISASRLLSIPNIQYRLHVIMHVRHACWTWISHMHVLPFTSLFSRLHFFVHDPSRPAPPLHHNHPYRQSLACRRYEHLLCYTDLDKRHLKGWASFVVHSLNSLFCHRTLRRSRNSYLTRGTPSNLY